MKSLFTGLFLAYTIFSFGQEASDIFNKSEHSYTYLGIDYSQAKFIGDFTQFVELGEVGYVRIKEEYFMRWNNVVVNEPDKYNWEEALRKEEFQYDLTTVREINDGTSVEDMEAQRAEELSREDIGKRIKGYDFNVKKGIGVVIIAEYLNKNKAEGCFHFVAMNMSTKEILLHKRYVEEGGGFGLRNYWVRPIFEIVDDIRKFTYSRWKREYK